MNQTAREENELSRGIQIIVLLCHTVFSLVLVGEALFLGWEIWALFLVMFNLIACWILHIQQIFTPETRLWVCEGTQMIMYFFYGVHSTSFFDLTPVILIAIFVYTMTQSRARINVAISTFLLTVVYDIVVMMGDEIKTEPLTVTRIVLHIAIVLGCGWVSYSVIERGDKDNEAIQRRIAQMEETNRRSEDFLTNVSHELRTPINAVTGLSGVLLKGNIDARTQAGLISIQEAGKRLFNQISDILDYTEIGSNKLIISEDQYEISSVVNDVIAEQAMLDRSGNIELLFDVDVNVPHTLLGDPRMIKKIILHIVDNAYKFSERGVIYVRIKAPEKQYGVNLDIEVTDTGKGIAREEIPNITNRYYQGDSTRTRSSGGLGLGLAIVSGITVAMNGFYRISSTPGEGTTVSVSIPQKVVDPQPCISISGREAYRIAFYLRQEIFDDQAQWEYYNRLVAHIAEGLSIEIRRLASAEEIRNLVEQGTITHIFTGQQEYMAGPDFFERLSGKCRIIVITAPDANVIRHDNITQLRLPISGFSLVQALRIEEDASEEDETFGKSRMYCPGVKALVVDDEMMNLVVAKGILKDYQIEVDTAESGAKAIEKVAGENYDIIFMDHMMPEMDGVEAQKRIRRLHSEKKQIIVALTANAVSGAREMFINEGFDEFIPKPIELNNLERVLRKVLPKSAVKIVKEEEKEFFEPDFRYNDIHESRVREGTPIAKTNTIADRFAELGLDTDRVFRDYMGEELFMRDVMDLFLREYEKRENKDDVSDLVLAADIIGLDSSDMTAAEVNDRINSIRQLVYGGGI